MAQHPLDPLSVNEVRQASRALLNGLSLQREQIRFKVIDLAEPSKDETLIHLLEHGPVPDRRARIYYQQKQKEFMSRSIINITSGVLEKTDDLPDAQGPVDWVEYELITTACNAHPDVLAEVAKLQVPEG